MTTTHGALELCEIQVEERLAIGVCEPSNVPRVEGASSSSKG